MHVLGYPFVARVSWETPPPQCLAGCGVTPFPRGSSLPAALPLPERGYYVSKAFFGAACRFWKHASEPNFGLPAKVKRGSGRVSAGGVGNVL